jgi:hypothetical protein
MRHGDGDVTRRRVVIIGVLVALTAVLTFRYVLWIDLGERCYLFIRLSLVGYDTTAVKRALHALKHGSPADYRTVCTHVATINPNPSCGGFGGGCFWHGASQQGRVTIDISTEHGLPWTIAIIVNETCHAIQFHEGRPPGHDLETECYREDDRILRALVQFE